MHSPETLSALVREVVEQAPIYDMHTHLYDPAFGELLLWGIDDLLTYHYLIAEGFRSSELSPEKFWALSKSQQAEHIWDQLFVRHSPVSEACRGVLTTLNALGFDLKKRDLAAIRQHYSRWAAADFTTQVLELANVRKVCMTNSPFDDLERPVWERGFPRDARFVAALRIDPLLLDWENTAPKLHAAGYEVRADFSGQTFSEVRRFLADWTRRIDSQYCMVSLPPDFDFLRITPDAVPKIDTTEARHGMSYPRAACSVLIEHAILPHGREHGQPFAMMIGVRRSVNPQLRMAGDSLGAGHVPAIERLCATFPENKFLCTMLAREDQHALCVAGRKFRNLHIFGCWWFLNTPSLIEEITRMRLELLGLSFTPQHSDARVLDQLIYKWAHTREVLTKVLAEKYATLATAGWEPSRAEIERDVHGLLGGELEAFIAR
jgi:hypothetical protein